MRAGGGKEKGAKFERMICARLSLWISDGATSDVFWRSAMSGGRATVLHKQGKRGSNAAGDICATGEIGHKLTDHYFIETKFYSDLSVIPFLMGHERGKLWSFWQTAIKQAGEHGKVAMLIAKQNMMPVFVVTDDLEEGLPSLWPHPPEPFLVTKVASLYWFDDLFPLPKVKKPAIIVRPKKIVKPSIMRRPDAA